jgi:hypothetical protein
VLPYKQRKQVKTAGNSCFFTTKHFHMKKITVYFQIFYKLVYWAIQIWYIANTYRFHTRNVVPLQCLCIVALTPCTALAFSD